MDLAKTVYMCHLAALILTFIHLQVIFSLALGI